MAAGAVRGAGGRTAGGSRMAAVLAALNITVELWSRAATGAGVGGVLAGGRGKPARSRTSSVSALMAWAFSTGIPPVVRAAAAFGDEERTSTTLPAKSTSTSIRSATPSEIFSPVVSAYRMAASLSRRISGTATMPRGWPPSRCSAWAVPGDDWSSPLTAWRELCTARKIVSAVRGMSVCLTASRGSTPFAYQPIALGPLTMNIAARST